MPYCYKSDLVTGKGTVFIPTETNFSTSTEKLEILLNRIWTYNNCD